MDMAFRSRVYEVTRQIPAGKVATYGQIARLAGNIKVARAVGMYMKTNPDFPQTPCHRVVASNGSLTGYSGKGGIPGEKEMLTIIGDNRGRFSFSWGIDKNVNKNKG